MNNKIPWYLKFIYGVIGFVLGCYAILTIQHYHEFSFESKLTLGDATNACTAFIIAILVTHYLEKHNKREDREKGILLHQLGYVSSLISDFEVANEGGNIISIVGLLKQMRRACDSFSKSVSELKYPANIVQESNFGELHAEIRKLATDTPINEIAKNVKRSNCSASVKNNIITLTEQRKALLESKVSDMKDKIFRVQILINNC